MTDPSDHAARHRIRTDVAEVLFVEAGAGTGKTHALVDRVVELLATGHLTSTAGLAAITFTENAAAELRNRLRDALATAAEGHLHGRDFDATERDRLLTAGQDLDDAVLTTLHGFASRILADAALEAGLPPGFSVAGALAGSDGAERSWEDFLDALLDDGAIREHLLRALTLGLTIDKLADVATALGASWDRLRDRPLTARPVPPIGVDEIAAPLRRALRDPDAWPDDALAAHLRSTVAPLLADLTNLTDPLDLLERLAAVTLAPGNKGRGPDWARAGLDKPTIVAALKDADAARAAALQAVGAAATEALAARVQDWLLEESERRRDTGELDYHDLLVLARDVLRDDPEVRARLHARWPALLVDEFQDTDPLQVEIAYLLAGDPGGHGSDWSQTQVAGARLFFVGDPKQSIYRFRGADVHLFNAVGARHATRPRLEVNFRSVPGVLTAANTAFRTLFDPGDGIVYADLLPSRTAVDDIPPVLLLGGPQAGVKAKDLRLAEATHLADVMVRAKGGWQVREGRPARFQDMAVLLPTRASLPALERALAERQVPYRIESRSLVWGTDAVRSLVTLLQAVDVPADEVALLASLRHPGLACSDVDLVTWRAAGGRWSLFASIPAGLEGHPVAAALATLRGWHDQRWWVPVNQLLDTIIRELRLVELTTVEERPRDHWRRLRFLVDQARAWCDSGGSGLGRFVAWAVRQIAEDADVLETVVPEPDDDAVRILTIHGAKGLEFPITMVAGLGSIVIRQDAVLWTDSGPQVRLKADALETSGYPQAVEQEKLARRQEDIRLLYVAVTRAEDHLVLGCYHSPRKDHKARQSAAQQLWGLLSDEGVARRELRPLTGAPAAPSPVEPAHLGVVHDSLPDRGTFVDDRRALLQDLAARVATNPTSLAAAAAGTPPEPDNEAPEEVTPVVRRTSSRGAAIGTATHRVLELLPSLTAATADQVARLSRLACAEADIPDLESDVSGRVWSALQSPLLTEALSDDARALREVYLVVRDGDRFLEGYVDLLVDSPDRGLTVLDHKTDRAVTAEEVAAKQAHYEPQLDAYARAVEQVTGTAPSSTGLVFARPGGRPPETP